MRSTLFSNENAEIEAPDGFALQNKKTLKATLTQGQSLYALKGSMVAFQGDVEFHHKSAGGVGKWLKQNLSGEDTPLMTVSARSQIADVFFADQAKDLFIVELEGPQDSISVNGDSLLAFESSLEYDVHRVKGAGMMSGGAFNTLIKGKGRVALATDGQPFILSTRNPTSVDIQAAVAWSGNISPSLRNSMNMKSMLRGGSGEAFQYFFHGEGFVVVQPSEGQPPAAQQSSGGGISSLLS